MHSIHVESMKMTPQPKIKERHSGSEIVPGNDSHIQMNNYTLNNGMMISNNDMKEQKHQMMISLHRELSRC